MAPSSNLISVLFFTTLVFSLQTNARESQFFSKVPRFNNNVKETEVVPSNNEAPLEKEEAAAFIPQTDNSYGLYGHESGLNPPSTTTTTTTYEPYKSDESEETSKFTNNNNYYSFNKDSYSTKQNELSDARLAGNSYSSNNYFYDNTKDNNGFSDKKYTEEGYNSPMENQKYYTNNNNERYSFNNNNGGERQGLSDTRFMEGGKYFYDVNSEKYNPTSARVGVRSESENWYNNRGYFGNYENKKSMEGYQNQDVFEDNQQEVFEP